MRSAALYPSYAHQSSLRRRVIAFGLAVAIQLLILWVLLGLAPFTQRPPQSTNKPLSFDLLPTRDAAARPTRSAAKKRASSAARQAPAAAKPPPPDPIPTPPTPPTPPLAMIVVSRDVFAAADISRMPSRRPAADPGNSEGADVGRDSGSADGKGEGPGGERLYHAEWFRRPTRAELAYYLPKASKGSWGMIACRTIPGNRVEDCRELGDSPVGSGLAGAVRQAAWQFRVLPPRVGGRPLIGAWVRIRIDISDKDEN